jgi:hypothetical protein
LFIQHVKEKIVLRNLTAVIRIMRQASVSLALMGVLLAGMVRTASAEVRVLLIPDRTGDRVLAFDPFDGHLINANFIPDDGRLAAPKTAIASGRGTILVADQVNHSVFEYGLNGVYIRTIADRPTHGIENIRGIAVRDGVVYVTCASGTHANTVQKITLAGVSLGTFAGMNLNSPFDILFRQNDVLVTSSLTDDVERYAFDGGYLTKFVASDGMGALNFPQQMFARSNGNILVTSFSDPVGIFEYSAAGVQLNYFAIAEVGPRGVHELGNGRYLFTQGGAVATYAPANGQVQTIHGDVDGEEDFQYIHSVLISVNVSGTVLLEDCPDASVPLTFQFRPTDGSATVVRSVTPNPDGTFTVLNVPAKDYDLAIKGAKWLRKVVAVNGLNGDVGGVNALLIGGDANNDNRVDVLDLDVLIQRFDTCLGESGYNSGPDFNCDDCVDVLDLDILIRNFDAQGDA